MRLFFLSPVIYSIVKPRSQDTKPDTKPDRKLANQSPRQSLTIGASLAILPQQAAAEKRNSDLYILIATERFYICTLAIIFCFHACTV